MDIMENSQRTRKSVKVDNVGRPRVRPLGEDIILGFKVSDATVKALDAEAEIMSRERPAGASRVSRTECLKILVAEALAARAATRTKPRQ
jgi:hypothetical protein